MRLGKSGEKTEGGPEHLDQKKEDGEKMETALLKHVTAAQRD